MAKNQEFVIDPENGAIYRASEALPEEVAARVQPHEPSEAVLELLRAQGEAPKAEAPTADDVL